MQRPGSVGLPPSLTGTAGTPGAAGMSGMLLLTARRHVDLLRVTAAACR